MVKLFVSNSPFLRLVIPMMLGIWISYHHSISFTIVGVATVIALTIYGLFTWYYRVKPNYQLGFLSGILMVVFMLSFGMLNYSIRKPYIIESTQKESFRLRINRSVGETEKNTKYEAVILSSLHDSTKEHVGLKGIIYLSKNNTIDVGTVVNVQGKLLNYDSPQIPYQFNYSRYLKNNRIAFRMVVSTFAIQANPANTFNFEIYLLKYKEYFNRRLRQFGMQPEELAILNAMFLGDKFQLTQEQKHAFVGAGAMHLLAVSGLHVGIIYLLLSFLFGAVFKNRKAVFVSVFVMLWLYAVLTGFSASVLRATIMFSVIEIGKFSQRRISIVNLLSVSMFIILLIDPLFVFSVGFWLSHCAVASIVLFYPYVNSWVYFRFPPFCWLWSVLALSLTAQLGALPISLATFHQFPLLFIFTNWLLIPIVTPVLVLALICAILSPLSIVMQLFVPALNDLLSYMNNVASSINEWPYASISHISFSNWQMILLYAILIMVLIRSEFKTYKSLQWLLVVLVLFVSSTHLNRFLNPQEGITIIETDNGMLVNYFNPEINEVYMSTGLNESDVGWMLSGIWSEYGVMQKTIFYQTCSSADSIIETKNVNGKIILIIRENLDLERGRNDIHFDYLVQMSSNYCLNADWSRGSDEIMFLEKGLRAIWNEKK
nr:ComEC/Rec2 family competence protein [uncultured Carboxylicivirga sp.]